MKHPYLTSFERQLIYADTLNGASLILRLRWKQFERELLKTKLFKFMLKQWEKKR